MSYCDSTDVRQAIGYAHVNEVHYSFTKYITRSDAELNSVLRNFFVVPLVSGEASEDTWSLINGLSADLAGAYLMRDMAAVSQNKTLLAGAKDKIIQVNGFLKRIAEGEIILTGSEVQTNDDEELVVPKLLIGGPDNMSYFANRDEANIDYDASQGIVEPQAPFDPDTSVQII